MRIKDYNFGFGLGSAYNRESSGGGGTPSIQYTPARGFYIPQDAFYGVDGVTINASGVNTTAYTVSFLIFGCDDPSGTAGSTTPGPQQTMYGGALMVSDPTSRYEVSNANGVTTFAKGIACSFDSTASRFAFNFNNSAGAVVLTDAIEFSGDASAHLKPDIGRWNSYVISWDTSIAGRWILYKNGVDMRAAGYAVAQQFVANCIFDLYNANGFKLNGYNQAIGIANVGTAWYADFWINQTYIGNSSNTLAANTLAKFFDINAGMPVDLLADGSGPTGAIPALFIADRGNGIPTQRGAATAAFAYGAAVNVPAVVGNNKGFPAPFGPGAPIPTNRVVQIAQAQNNRIPGGAGTHTFVVSSGGQPLKAGDFVVITFTGADSSNLGSHNPVSSDGLTRFPAAMTYGASGEFECCIFSGFLASDALSGQDFTVTVASGYTSRTNIGLHIFRNVASVDQQVFVSKDPTSSVSATVGAGNTTKKQLLLTFVGVWRAALGMTPPALGTGTLSTVLYRERSASVAVSACQIMLCAEEEVPAGSAYARTVTLSSADNWQCISMGLSVT